MSGGYQRLVPYSARPRNKGDGAPAACDADIPRVEQSYKTLYPTLDVDELLEVSYENEPKRKPKSITGSLRSSRNGVQTLTGAELGGDYQMKLNPALVAAGYHNRGDFARGNTMMLHDALLQEPYPEGLSAADKDAFPGSVDGMEFCEYDMDEQDLGILGYLVSRFQVPLSAEIFEVIMTMLELESYKVDLLMPTKTRQTSQTAIDETQQCVVCNGAESENSNVIIFCDGCNIAVHQDCYGVPFIPEGQWLCRRCLESRDRATVCLFCPRVSGAFKQTDTHAWSHVLCGLWIPELEFLNTTFMEPVSNVCGIPKSRWKLPCYVCRDKRGACIQCANKNCFQAFHATCAQAAGLYMHMNAGLSGALHDKTTMVAYCDKHTPPDAGYLVDLQAARKSLEVEREESDSLKSLSTKRYPYWRTTGGALLVPEVIKAAVARNIRQRFGLDLGNDVLSFICRYWTLKRSAQGTFFSKRLKLAVEASKFSSAAKAQTAAEQEDSEARLAKLLRVAKSVETLLTENKPARSSRRWTDTLANGSSSEEPRRLRSGNKRNFEKVDPAAHDGHKGGETLGASSRKKAAPSDHSPKIPTGGSSPLSKTKTSVPKRNSGPTPTSPRTSSRIAARTEQRSDSPAVIQNQSRPLRKAPSAPQRFSRRLRHDVPDPLPQLGSQKFDSSGRGTRQSARVRASSQDRYKTDENRVQSSAQKGSKTPQNAKQATTVARPKHGKNGTPADRTGPAARVSPPPNRDRPNPNHSVNGTPRIQQGRLSLTTDSRQRMRKIKAPIRRSGGFTASALSVLKAKRLHNVGDSLRRSQRIKSA